MLESVVSIVHDVSSYLAANSEQNLDDVVTKLTGIYGIIHSPQLAQLLPLIHLLPQVLHSNSPEHLF